VPDTTESRAPGEPQRWGGGEKFVATVVLLALLTPLAIVAIGTFRTTSAADLARLATAAEGTSWPLLIFFALVVWRAEIPHLLARLRRAGPKGLEFTDKAISKVAAAQGRQARRPLAQLEPPQPAADAAVLSDETEA
jgi:hypothetical protein